MKTLLALTLGILVLNLSFAPLGTPVVRAQGQEIQSEVLTNKDVLEMHTSGLSTDVITAKIRASKTNFDTSTAALQTLKAAGVNDIVILAIVQSSLSDVRGSAPADRKQVLLPDGTQFSVVMIEDMDSKTAVEGDPVTFKVDEDVVIDGHVVIAKGALAKGTVSEVQKSGRMGRAGKLGIRVEQTDTVDDQRVKLRATQNRQGDDKTGSVIALTLLVSPLFLLKRGKRAKIKAGTKINVFTDEDKRVLVPIGSRV